MKKTVYIAFIVLFIACLFVSCNGQVDYHLWVYKVTFDYGSGSIVQYVNEGKKASIPTTPKNGNMVFAGWYTTENWEDGEKWDFDTLIGEEVNLYAKWWNPFLTFTGTNEFTITPEFNGEGTLEYCTSDPQNDENWKDVSSGNSISSAVFDSKHTIMFRGLGNTIITGENGWKTWQINYTGENKIDCSGNIMTLLDYQNPDSAVMGDYCFQAMLANWTSEEGDGISSLPELPAETLSNYCYYYMFATNTLITEIPENYLPATELKKGCYYNMFSSCRGLTKVPKNLLPATKMVDECYSFMFIGCSNLTKTPDLPSTELAGHCYDSMFYECKNLTITPDLPATELAESCYANMFRGCTNLTKTPDLPATELAKECYAFMFQECTSLKDNVIDSLNATTLQEGCYKRMFYSCSNLVKAPAIAATKLAKECCYEMFGYCSSLKYAPDLHAEELEINCYYGMFDQCSSLIKGPVISATAFSIDEKGYFTKGCCEQMFINCFLLKTLEVGFTSMPSGDCAKALNKWLKNAGISATSPTLTCPASFFAATPSVESGDPSTVPNGWRVVNK